MRPVKHSLTVKGHRTSVSLEAPFWAAFREVAEAEGRSLNDLASDIDVGRGADCGLASAIRLFVLDWYARRAAIPEGGPARRLAPDRGP
jgi:predicted DNA-binding ribbon-helix-helix protein